jgi:alcohol dehydrogenase YqhD (iron-dependent ADH family)
MVASDFAHSGITGFGRQGDWSNHPMEEEISGIYDIPHGAGLSVITPAWMRYVYKKHLPMFVQFAVNVMGVQGDIRNEERTALEGIDALEDYSRKLGLPLHLSEFGIDNKNFKKMADRIIARLHTPAKLSHLIRTLRATLSGDTEPVNPAMRATLPNRDYSECCMRMLIRHFSY